MSDKRYTRRDFISTGATAAFGVMIVPRFVLGRGYRAPSDRLDLAFVGIGGMGMENMAQFLDENIVAVCDVDYGYVERQLEGRMRPRQGETAPNPQAVRLKDAYTKARKYSDFRKMLEKEKSVDAVVIATPDHTHAVIAVAAMQAGKHVYVQKPLTTTVYEARLLARTARETKRVTQMGNQGHSRDGTRRIVELIAAGVIGPVREVHVWTDRPQRYWAQGIPRPGQDVAQAAAEKAAREKAAQQQAVAAQGAAQARLTRSSRRRPARSRRRPRAGTCGRWTRQCSTRWRRTRTPSPRGSTGTSSSAGRSTSPTTRSTTRSAGAAGSTSGPER